MSSTARRGLGPQAQKVMAGSARAPRTPPPWSPAAIEARTFGLEPVAAVDHLVRDLTAQLTRWQQALDRLADDLAKAAQGRPLPEHAADTGRTEDVRWRQARAALLEAVARHHHGALPAGVPSARPW